MQTLFRDVQETAKFKVVDAEYGCFESFLNHLFLVKSKNIYFNECKHEFLLVVFRNFVVFARHFCEVDICGNSSADRALAFQAKGRGFESRFPLT